MTQSAGVVGHDGARESGVGLRRSDGDSRQHSATLIGDPAREFGRRLRPGHRARQQHTHHNDQNLS